MKNPQPLEIELFLHLISFKILIDLFNTYEQMAHGNVKEYKQRQCHFQPRNYALHEESKEVRINKNKQNNTFKIII